MTRRAPLRAVLPFLLALPACAALLDLPDPILDNGLLPDGGDPAKAETGSSADGGSADDSASGTDAPGDSAAAADGDADTAAPTCSADLMTSLQNCGACGHDCSGGACDKGVCTVARDGVVTFYGALGLGQVGGQLVIGSGSSSNAGAFSCSKTGCVASGVTRLTTDVDPATTTVRSVAAIGSYVYWAENYKAGYGAYRTDLAGGNTVRVSQGDVFSKSASIAVSDAGIAWGQNDSNQRVGFCPLPNCSGAATLLPNAPGNATLGYSSAVEFAPDGSIVWVENSAIVRCTTPACGGGPQTIINGTGHANLGLAISGTTVYWTAATDDAIKSCPITGCPGGVATEVISGQSESTLVGLAISGSTLAWTLSGTLNGDGGLTTDGIVRKCDVSDCPGTVVTIAANEAAPIRTIIDANSIYWLNQGRTNYLNGASSIKKVPR